jgi:hypothetical protein
MLVTASLLGVRAFYGQIGPLSARTSHGLGAIEKPTVRYISGPASPQTKSQETKWEEQQDGKKSGSKAGATACIIFGAQYD